MHVIQPDHNRLIEIYFSVHSQFLYEFYFIFSVAMLINIDGGVEHLSKYGENFFISNLLA